MLKNGWKDWIFKSINSDAQVKALSTLENNQELFITKWTHGLILLACWHMKGIGQAKLDLCLCCIETIDTALHIRACEWCVQWQATFLDSPGELLVMLHIQPELQIVLMASIQEGVLQDDQLFHLPTSNCEASFKLLDSSQNTEAFGPDPTRWDIIMSQKSTGQS